MLAGKDTFIDGRAPISLLEPFLFYFQRLSTFAPEVDKVYIYPFPLLETSIHA